MTPPRLRALPGGAEPEFATATDREMIEATAAAVELVSAKWKVDLLYLLAAGIRRHGQLHDHLLVSKKVLSEALRALERDGLVHRRVFAERPVRIEYSLTPLGRSLTGPLFALYEWADLHLAAVSDARDEHDRRSGGPSSPAADRLPRFTAPFLVQGDQRRAAARR